MEKIEFKVAFQSAPNTPPSEVVTSEAHLIAAVRSALVKAPVCVISNIKPYEQDMD